MLCMINLYKMIWEITMDRINKKQAFAILG